MSLLSAAAAPPMRLHRVVERLGLERRLVPARLRPRAARLEEARRHREAHHRRAARALQHLPATAIHASAPRRLVSIATENYRPPGRTHTAPRGSTGRARARPASARSGLGGIGIGPHAPLPPRRSFSTSFASAPGCALVARRDLPEARARRCACRRRGRRGRPCAARARRPARRRRRGRPAGCRRPAVSAPRTAPTGRVAARRGCRARRARARAAPRRRAVSVGAVLHAGDVARRRACPSRPRGRGCASCRCGSAAAAAPRRCCGRRARSRPGTMSPRWRM